MTPFDEKRINWFNAIARFKNKNKNLLPELNYEVIGSNNPAKWIKLAEKEGLKPSTLRRLIRNSEKTFKNEKHIKVATWPKMLVLLENELKHLNEEQRNIAKSKIDELKKVI